MNNRSRTPEGEVVCEELADKINAEFRNARKFVVAERFDPSALFDGKTPAARRDKSGDFFGTK